MRLLVCALGLWLCACGKVSRQQSAQPIADGGSSAGGSTAGESGDFGEWGANGGMTSAGGESGGRPPIAGTGGTAGSGGYAPEPANDGGEGGELSGTAGAPDLGDDETYDACGCGCCGAPLQNRCYYPELGENLIEVKAEDRAARSNPGCANAGCSAGVHYVRCETPELDAGAMYQVVGYSDNRQHLIVRRTTLLNRCTAMSTVDPGPSEKIFPLELPGKNGFQQSEDGVCNQTTLRTQLGALGFMKQSAPHSCAYDFDFTLFYLADDGTDDAVRFKADGISLPGMEHSTCP